MEGGIRYRTDIGGGLRCPHGPRAPPPALRRRRGAPPLRSCGRQPVDGPAPALAGGPAARAPPRPAALRRDARRVALTAPGSALLPCGPPAARRRRRPRRELPPWSERRCVRLGLAADLDTLAGPVLAHLVGTGIDVEPVLAGSTELVGGCATATSTSSSCGTPWPSTACSPETSSPSRPPSSPTTTTCRSCSPATPPPGGPRPGRRRPAQARSPGAGARDRLRAGAVGPGRGRPGLRAAADAGADVQDVQDGSADMVPLRYRAAVPVISEQRPDLDHAAVVSACTRPCDDSSPASRPGRRADGPGRRHHRARPCPSGRRRRGRDRRRADVAVPWPRCTRWRSPGRGRRSSPRRARPPREVVLDPTDRTAGPTGSARCRTASCSRSATVRSASPWRRRTTPAPRPSCRSSVPTRSRPGSWGPVPLHRRATRDRRRHARGRRRDRRPRPRPGPRPLLADPAARPDDERVRPRPHEQLDGTRPHDDARPPVARGSALPVREAMRRQVWRHRVASGFPHDDVVVAGKTGTLGRLRHEIAVVEIPGEVPVAVSVLTRSLRPESHQPRVDTAIGVIARTAVHPLRRPAPPAPSWGPDLGDPPSPDRREVVTPRGRKPAPEEEGVSAPRPRRIPEGGHFA